MKRRSSAVGRTIARYFGWIALGIALILWGQLGPAWIAGQAICDQLAGRQAPQLVQSFNEAGAPHGAASVGRPA